MAPARSGSAGRGGLRSAALGLAVLIALASTAAVVISDDPQTLRVAVVGALWAFVLAAFAAPRRRETEPDGDGPGSALDRYPNAEHFMAMLKSGKRPDGSAVSTVMPFVSLQEMNEVDVRALYAYLRSLPAS